MKQKSRFVCSACGHASLKWMGRCAGCEAWNTLEEERVPAKGQARASSPGPAVALKKLGEVEDERQPRYTTGHREFDRVLGGGLVPGSLLLVAGDPGVGKSTLLLQAASAYAAKGLHVVYVAAEESETQIRLRSRRLGEISPDIRLLAGTRMDDVAARLEGAGADVIIVDSVQTLHHPDAASAPGSVGQVRANTLYFLEMAKNTKVPVILVGHVTKEGQVAGPRVMEHMVDAVLYLEGDRFHHYRMFRAAKNRFGPTHEVGLFEMGDSGLREVENASEFLLEERRAGTSGSAVLAAIEGTRPLLLEVQALVGAAGYGTPRRVATGIDAKRLSVLLAVLERRAGMNFSASDVFVSVAGGVRVAEPAMDLAVVAAVASSYHDIPLDPQTVVLGEVGLGGEVRRVGHLDRRLHEAARLGFRSAVVPTRSQQEPAPAGLQIAAVGRVDEAVRHLLGVTGGAQPPAARRPEPEPLAPKGGAR